MFVKKIVDNQGSITEFLCAGQACVYRTEFHFESNYLGWLKPA